MIYKRWWYSTLHIDGIDIVRCYHHWGVVKFDKASKVIRCAVKVTRYYFRVGAVETSRPPREHVVGTTPEIVAR